LNAELEKYKSVSIIGAARSGIAAAKLLRKNGFNVFISDSAVASKISENFRNEILESGFEVEFGKHSERVYKSDLIVVSPGVPQNSKVIQTALEKGIDVVSEIEAASWFCKGKLIAITGTNGKTTTTTLIGEIFKDAGIKTFVCGNIGLAFSDVVENITEDAIAVLEISSFQLDNIKYFSPLIAIILNITPDHLDRYDHSFEKYAESKMRIAENQGTGDHLVYNFDSDELKKKIHNGKTMKAHRSAFSLNGSSLGKIVNRGMYSEGTSLLYFYEGGVENIIDSGSLAIKGPHNVYNTMASVIPAKIFDINTDTIVKTLTSFKGVEHRLEFVRDINGIQFYNDSKATNVDSVWYALQGFGQPIILILGGRDKGNDYEQIKGLVIKHVKHIIAIGESKEKIYNYFKDIVPVSRAHSLDDAVFRAAAEAKKNDIVLLSPACASFDMFDNYEQRGREFKRIVNAL